MPKPQACRDVILEDGAVTVVRRHGNPDGPRLVLSHGNGLAIDLYYPLWSLLEDEFDLIVFDLRNHGWNKQSSLSRHNIPQLIRDYARVVSGIDHHFGSKPKTGVFHSVSGMVSLISETQGAEFSGLVLFDPPICRRPYSYAEFEAAAARMSKLAERRTARFQSKRQFLELLPYSPSLQRVVPGVFQLLADTTLRELPHEQGYELCCPPEYEARIIEYASGFAVLVEFEHMLCPVKVLGADPTLPYSYLPTFDMCHVQRVDYDFIPDSTHFLPLEQPGECVAVLQEFLTRHDLKSR